MTVEIKEGVEGARHAIGTAVIIDVLRAATVAAYLLNKDVTSIIPVATKEEAFAHKKDHPDTILIGENHGIKISGFDIGNSPYEIDKHANLKGKCAVHRSSKGTQGIVNAINAQEVIFGSFVTHTAIITHLMQAQSHNITLVPMYAIEDHLYAQYLQAHLQGTLQQPIGAIKQQLMDEPHVRGKFFDPNNHHFPEEDFHLCIQESVFDFVPVVRDGIIIKHPITK